MDAEEIRKKRLAKLTESMEATRKFPESPPTTSTAKSKPSPKSKPLIPMEVDEPIRKPKAEKSTDSKMDVDPKWLDIKESRAQIVLSEEDWEHNLLSKALNISLVPSTKTYLEQIAKELESENEPLKMTKPHWERIIYSRLLLSTPVPLFDYLKNAWVKLQEWKTREPPIRIQKIDDLADLIMNYIGLVANPDTFDMFPELHQFGAGYFGHQLTLTSDPEQTYPRNFMQKLISKFKNEGLKEILSATVKSILTVLRTKRIYTDYKPCFRAFQYLISFKDLAELLVQLDEWLPEYVTGKDIEIFSILGPFLGRTCVFPDNDPAIVEKYFASNGSMSDNLYDTERGIGDRNRADVESIKSQLRDIIENVQQIITDIVLAIIKSGPAGKEGVLKYIAKAIKLNQKRGQIQVDKTQVCSDGYIHNLMQVCKKLCDPILDLNFSKLPLIDSQYFLKYDRLDISENTRLNCEIEKANEIASKHKTDQTPNFISDIFLLTTGLHHYGLLSTIRFYKNFIKELQEMQKSGARHQMARDNGQWQHLNPLARQANEQGMLRLQTELDRLLGMKLAMETVLFDKLMLERTIEFYSMLMMFVIKTMSSKQHNWKNVSLGIGKDLFPVEECDEFMCLPEWIIEDICDFYLFIMRYKAPIFENTPRNEFMTFASVILYNSELIKNPYLKSKLIEIMYSFTLPLWRTQTGETMGRLDGPFFTHPFMREYLVDSILRFYTDVERTGTSSQFYDKFNIRYNISQILKSIWTDQGYVKKAIELSQKEAFFVKFVNLLMNDTTFLLDESLSKLKEIGNIQTELQTPPNGAEEIRIRQERESVLQSNERQAMSYMALANATVDMFGYLTLIPEIVKPFMASEIVSRLAAMLDYNMVALAGPKCSELKVENPEKYQFDPKKLLGGLTTVFINLSDREEFILACARDGRSFDKKVFERAAGILSKHLIKTPDEIQKLMSFVKTVEDLILKELKNEEELGEVPDEFLDPLLFTLMEEPVKLPSGVSVDLSTIRSHLLSDQHDPFNRQPLTIEQVVPDEALKARILEWKQINSKK